MTWLALALCAHAESAKIIKVLPHFLDLKGRDTVNPSLFDRDAYQAELRNNPSKRSALRFDVHWKAPYYDYDSLRLRIEAKGMIGGENNSGGLGEPLKAGIVFRLGWAVKIAGEQYEKFGELIAWRATLVSGTNVVAEQRSFLW